MRTLRWLILSSGLAWAGSGGSSGLVIQVKPEAWVDPPDIHLTFQVNQPGEVVDSAPLTVTGWVRALPGQPIRILASSDRSVDWSSFRLSATGGAAAASCLSGGLDTGLTQDLVSNWTQSGIIRCSITFHLHSQNDWLPGTYNVRIALRPSS